MQTFGSETSKFISVPVKDGPDEFHKDVRTLKHKNESVLSMLLDKFYSQKDLPQVVSSTGDQHQHWDKTALAGFLSKFGLSSFVPQLATLGYHDKISSFFFIPDKCFNRALDTLKVNSQQRSVFKQLRKELIQLKIDTDLAAQKQSLENVTTKNSLVESSRMLGNTGILKNTSSSLVNRVGRENSTAETRFTGGLNHQTRTPGAEEANTEGSAAQTVIYSLRYLPCQCCKKRRRAEVEVDQQRAGTRESRPSFLPRQVHHRFL